MKRKLHLVPQWLKRLFTTPTAELSRWQYAVRYFLELCRHGARQLRQDRAGQMAAALSYRTIFGLIPLIVIATLLFQAFGGAEAFKGLVRHLLESGGLYELAGPDEEQTLGAWAASQIDRIGGSINAGTIGVVGGLVLAWATIGLLTTIERCFNTVCRAQEHRTMSRRIPLYWTIVTIGPILLFLSFRLEGRLRALIEQWGGSGPAAMTIGAVMSFVAAWLFLLVLYVLMPHTRINLAAAAAGSFVAALLWTGATNAFASYFAWSFSRQSSAFTILYGSLGLIPLFLLWIYFLWLVVLYGLEITSVLQTVGRRLDGRLPERGELPPLVDPAAVIPMMQVIAERFEGGRVTTSDELVDRTRCPRRAIELMLDALVADGVLHRVETAGESGYALARPPDRINTGQLLRVAQTLTDAPGPADSTAWHWVRRFREAQLDLTMHRPLADL